jgi:two-component system NtrC family sensor kinase
MKMFMKLIFSFVLITFIILIVDGYISFHRQVKVFETNIIKNMNIIGLTMKLVIEDTWQKDGEQQAFKIINDVSSDESHIRIRFVWLDVPSDSVHAPKILRKNLNSPIVNHFVVFKGQEKKYIYAYVPISVDKQRPAALELSESLSYRDEYTLDAAFRLIVLTVLLSIVALLFSTLMGARIIGQPMKLLVDKMKRIGASDYSGPLLLSGHDELTNLSVGINTMCEQIEGTMENLRTETEARIAALEQLRHQDRLKTVGRLASGIAHELGTPLNVISGRAVMIAHANLVSAEIRENATIIKKQSDRITSIFRQLLDFARQKPSRKRPLDLQQMLQQSLNLMSPIANKKKIEISLTGDKVPVMGHVDADQLQQVMMNLLTNAIQAMPVGGNIELGIHRVHTHSPEEKEVADSEYNCIYIQDNGQGISKENIGHIFEPFFTTKETGEGTGLGLSIVYGIIRENNGWIEVTSEQNKGSQFFIYLPVED